MGRQNQRQGQTYVENLQARSDAITAPQNGLRLEAESKSKLFSGSANTQVEKSKDKLPGMSPESVCGEKQIRQVLEGNYPRDRKLSKRVGIFEAGRRANATQARGKVGVYSSVRAVAVNAPDISSA